jgi:hypothetical protein
MTPVPAEDAIKFFGITSQLIEHDLNQVEREYAVDLRRDHRPAADVDEAYYPQIENEIRAEAAAMAPHYEVFYSLETTIRRLIRDQLQEAQPDWWEKRVPEHVRKEAEKRKKREEETGFTRRSDEPIDFLTFGELSEVIKTNWDVFGAVFSNAKAVERVMGNLNTLRGPIAHCAPLAEDEVVRLRLSVRDWFRLGE